MPIKSNLKSGPNDGFHLILFLKNLVKFIDKTEVESVQLGNTYITDMDKCPQDKCCLDKCHCAS